MIHFTCDCCKRVIDLDEEVRFVVRMEVFAAADTDSDVEDDRDYLLEIEEMISDPNATGDAAIGEEVYQQARFDLCGECRKKFVRDPLGRISQVPLGFSNN